MTAINKRKIKLAAAPELVTPLFVVLFVKLNFH